MSTYSLVVMAFCSAALVLDTLWTDWTVSVRSGFKATKWVRLARVRIQLLKEIKSAFRCLLKHTFSITVTMVTAVETQLCAEFAGC
jgi:hypothetical protein